MKKKFTYSGISLLLISLIVAFNSQAQQSFTITSSRENNYCNTTCTLFDRPDLNGNPDAVLFITAVEVNGINLNPHPICAYYINKKWSVVNTDNSKMAPGSQFNVTYYSNPDATHFVHVVTRDNLVKYKNSYIDHAGLNNNPGAQFKVIQNWSPGVRGGNMNPNEIKIQYDAGTGKWYISNANEKQLEFPVAYNIVISAGGNIVEAPVKVIKDIAIKDPKTVVQPVDKTTVINKPVSQKEIDPRKVLQKAYDFSDIRICIDKSLIKNVPPKAVFVVPVIPKIKSNGEIETVSAISQPLVGYTELMWTPGQEITVGFASYALNKDILKVKNYVKEWEIYANIHFVFVDNVNGNLGNAKIRIGFNPNGTSWSWVGRQVLDNPRGEMTMNFGWFNDKSSTEAELKRVVLHEFGHALGFIDEFLPPTSSGASFTSGLSGTSGSSSIANDSPGIPWDQEKTYDYFEGLGEDWNHQKVNSSVFAKYAKVSSNSSQYDRLSIMHYSYPPGLTKDGSTFPLNMNLSEADKAFARQVYPFPRIPPTAKGVLFTGDDCDEIDFTVEYNVLHYSEIEFALKPGWTPNGNQITWWKMITIPKIYGQQTGLEMQDGHSSTKKIPEDMIDRNRGISFGKAKFAGVHTGLVFTWDAWPAIVGGCRVTLEWRRDRCSGF